jgi:hypothetical protein
MKYTVIFEFAGRKYKKQVSANNEETAKYLVSGQILNAVKFLEVTPEESGKDFLNEIFGKFN